MDSKRKRRREAKLLETVKKYRQERPKISDQFADLKQQLKGLSSQDWDSIPDTGDYSLRLKQKKRARKGEAESGLMAARNTVLSLKLDKMSDSVTGQTVVDPKGYLTDLNSVKVCEDHEFYLNIL